MHIQERYSTARNTSNLKSDERTMLSASDVLAAAGMASQASPEALLMWETTFKGRTGAKLALVDMLGVRLTGEMLKRGWKGRPDKISTEVVAWVLHGTCQPCGGRKYEIIPGTPALSDKFCKHCEGTGKVHLPKTDAHAWLVDHIDKLIAQASGKVMKKLAIHVDM